MINDYVQKKQNRKIKNGLKRTFKGEDKYFVYKIQFLSKKIIMHIFLSLSIHCSFETYNYSKVFLPFQERTRTIIERRCNLFS